MDEEARDEEARDEEAREPELLGFLARLGAILALPRAAMVNAGRREAAGKAGSDLALLIALAFAVAHTELVAGGMWTVFGGDVGGGLMMVANGLAHFALRVVIVLGVSGGVIYLAAGNGRKLGRDFDLASVAVVPVLLMAMGATLAGQLGVSLAPESLKVVEVLGYAWSAGLTILAIVVARFESPPRAATVEMRLAGGAVLSVAVVSLILSGATLASHPERIKPVVSGDLAPSFRLPTIDARGGLGEVFDLESTRGKVVVLDFWATWCGPCREAMPVVQDIHVRYRERGVVVLSINTEGRDVAAAARRMATQLGVDTIQLSDDGRVANRFKVTTIPHMVVIDRRGVVRDVHRGFTTQSRLRNRLQSVVEELL